MNTLSINVHISPEAATASDIDRRHYSVAQLIAELKRYDGDTEVIIAELSTGDFGSINFQGLSVVRSKLQVIDVGNEVLQEFDDKAEADEYVLKLGDRSILAKVIEA